MTKDRIIKFQSISFQPITTEKKKRKKSNRRNTHRNQLDFNIHVSLSKQPERIFITRLTNWKEKKRNSFIDRKFFLSRKYSLRHRPDEKSKIYFDSGDPYVTFPIKYVYLVVDDSIIRVLIEIYIVTPATIRFNRERKKKKEGIHFSRDEIDPTIILKMKEICWLLKLFPAIFDKLKFFFV